MYRKQWQKPPQRIRNARRQSGWLSENALQIAEERVKVKDKGERERYTQLNAEFQRMARKAYLNEQCKEIEMAHSLVSL